METLPDIIIDCESEGYDTLKGSCKDDGEIWIESAPATIRI